LRPTSDFLPAKEATLKAFDICVATSEYRFFAGEPGVTIEARDAHFDPILRWDRSEDIKGENQAV
jgi:hypothetical protein